MPAATRIAALVVVATLAGCDPSAPPPDEPGFQRGFTLAGWTRDDYDSPALARQLEALRAAGVEWLALTARWWQPELASSRLAPDPGLSPSDESLRRAMRAARAAGFRVFLKPQVDVARGGWRGEIAFRSEAECSAWFRAYAAFVDHYARLAEEEGAALFAVGVELDGTRQRESEWRELIARVRTHFRGPLVYAANWGRETDIRWWDALDYAGVDAYFPLADGPQDSVAALRAAWRPHVARLRGWAARIRRPVILTEIGYRSVRGAGVAPWEWEREGAPSAAEQERLYRAALESLWPEPWVAGFYWWQWHTSPPRDPDRDTSYTPQGKPALAVVRDYYVGRPRPVRRR